MTGEGSSLLFNRHNKYPLFSDILFICFFKDCFPRHFQQEEQKCDRETETVDCERKVEMVNLELLWGFVNILGQKNLQIKTK